MKVIKGRFSEEVGSLLGLPVCESPQMKEIEQLIGKISRSDAPVLIIGESGTGKELVAKLIHQKSSRREKSFSAANVSAYSSSILESELFGHSRGSFTGALRDRKGLFTQAHGGTLFLDEIGDMGAEIQVKLLRVLEEKVVFPVGSNTDRPADVRIIAATNCDLKKKMQEGTFRHDFFYRIAAMQIYIPSLRERLEDIIPLAEYFISLESEKMEINPPSISRQVKKFLLSCLWAGNVRELRSVVELSLAFVDGYDLEMEHLEFYSERIKQESVSKEAVSNVGCSDCGKTGTNVDQKMLVELEKETILRALEKSHWVQRDAAEELGITPRAMNYRIKKFGITHRRWYSHNGIGGLGQKSGKKRKEEVLEDVLHKNNWSLRATAKSLGVSVNQLKKRIKEQGIKHPEGLWFGSWVKK
ncbi:MAG: two-component system, NtrC family, response regulator PilR [Patescibacteria group bacterium]|nr:two-component system, NtrC family, response regulator PilR [Patescibacteria group bacterium]